MLIRNSAACAEATDAVGLTPHCCSDGCTYCKTLRVHGGHAYVVTHTHTHVHGAFMCGECAAASCVIIFHSDSLHYSHEKPGEKLTSHYIVSISEHPPEGAAAHNIHLG